MWVLLGRGKGAEKAFSTVAVYVTGCNLSVESGDPWVVGGSLQPGGLAGLAGNLLQTVTLHRWRKLLVPLEVGLEAPTVWFSTNTITMSRQNLELGELLMSNEVTREHILKAFRETIWSKLERSFSIAVMTLIPSFPK